MEQLGINTSVLIAQVINFAVLAVVLRKFLYKPVIKKIEAKQKAEQEAKINQEKLAAQVTKSDALYEELLKKAKAQAAEILAVAKKEAKQEKQTILTEAAKEIEKEKTKLLVQMQQDMKTYETRVKAETLTIAKALTEKALAGMSEDFRKTSIDQALLTFKKING